MIDLDQNANLPELPANLDFTFSPHTVDDLAEVWRTNRRTIFRRLSDIRPIIGKPVNKCYTPMQVLIMCFIWDTPQKYYRTIIWMQTHGYDKYFAKKYGFEHKLKGK